MGVGNLSQCDAPSHHACASHALKIGDLLEILFPQAPPVEFTDPWSIISLKTIYYK